MPPIASACAGNSARTEWNDAFAFGTIVLVGRFGRRTPIVLTLPAVPRTLPRIFSTVVRFCLTGFRRVPLRIRTPIDAPLIVPRNGHRSNDPVTKRHAGHTRRSTRHRRHLGGLQSDDATSSA